MKCCNKEEAQRAMELAEMNFKSGDLEGARRLALKAKALLPSLLGLAQTLAAYDVHIAATKRKTTLGAVDWHSVLGVHPAADHDTAKKKFKEMCILTHPDKNRSAAAEGAFKLVMKAWEVVSSLPPKATAADGSPAWSSTATASPNQPADGKPFPSGPSSSTLCCPHCGTPNSYVIVNGHCVLDCKFCGTHSAIRLRQASSPSPPQPAGAQSAGVPPSEASCPDCGAPFGRKRADLRCVLVRCKQCGSWSWATPDAAGQIVIHLLRGSRPWGPQPATGAAAAAASGSDQTSSAPPAGSTTVTAPNLVSCPTCGRIYTNNVGGKRAFVLCRGYDGRGRKHFFVMGE